MVVVRLDAHDPRRLGGAETNGEDGAEDDRDLAEDVARMPDADRPRNSVDVLDRLDLAREDREQRAFAALVGGVLAGSEADVCRNAREPLALRGIQAREQGDLCDLLRRDHLVSPPVAPALDVFAPTLAETGRADDEDLQAVGPGLVASPRTGRDAHRVPFPEVDDLVVDLHPPAPADDHVDLLLRLVRMAVRKASAGRDALVAQTGLLELERIGREAELEVRRAVEVGPDVL